MITAVRYKAIIFDLDATAISNEADGLPSQKLVNAIEDAQGSIRLCAATGRSIAMARGILTSLNLKDPCVISGGTQIINPSTEEILWEIKIAPDDTNAILRASSPYKYEVLVNNELLGEGAPAANRAEINEDVNIVYIMGCAKADSSIILTELEKTPNVTASVVPSWTQGAVDIHITNKVATKEHAISKLLSLLQLDKSEVIGVGDADNDIHLFAGVGHKVAMGNGTERLKSLADEVTDSVNEDGLAKIITKYGSSPSS